MQNAKRQPARSAVVVGGGVVGLTCALSLQRKGIDTVVVDPEETWRRASWGNAGHLAVEQTEPLASPSTLRSFPKRLFWCGGALSLPARDFPVWMPFALRFIGASRPHRFRAGTAALSSMLRDAIPAWRRVAAAVGAGHLVLEDGHFIVWETPGRAREGREAWARADIGAASFRDATREELEMLSARMARPPAGAIRFLGTGQIGDIRELVELLTTGFVALGGTRHRDSIRRVDVIRSNAVLTPERGGPLSADIIVIACGVASGRLLKPLGYTVPIIAERGYHIESSDTDWPFDLPPVVFEERSMIVTRFRSGLRAASFVEFAREDSPPDPRKWARLRSHIAALGLSFGGPGVEWMGARPTLPDYLPAIGRSRLASNLFYAFGHQHLGLTLAAVTAEVIADMATGERSAIDLTPFDIERFR